MKTFQALASFVLLSAGVYSSNTHAAPVNFSPYVDLSVNARWSINEPADLLAISQASGIKSYHLAFINGSTGCNAVWGGSSPATEFDANHKPQQAWGQHTTQQLAANGIGYTLAFGGAMGTDLSSTCTLPDLVKKYEDVIATYISKGYPHALQGLDFDIENGSADVTKLITALKSVQATHPDLKISFTLPVLPEGLTADGKDVVKKAKDAGLNYTVNIMAMDFGPAYAQKTMGQYAIQAATNLHDFLKELYPAKTDAALWKMVEVTPMIGVNDVNTEKFTLNDVGNSNSDPQSSLRAFAEQKGLGGLSMWSVARDNPCASAWASPICSGDNLQTAPYDFAKKFMQ
jgi:chitinase